MIPATAICIVIENIIQNKKDWNVDRQSFIEANANIENIIQNKKDWNKTCILPVLLLLLIENIIQNKKDWNDFLLSKIDLPISSSRTLSRIRRIETYC